MPQNNNTKITDLGQQTTPVKLPTPYLIIGLLLLAIGLRMIYGYDLTKNFKDESYQIEFIQTLSIKPGELNLPMGNPVSHHTVLTAYINALSYWLTNGSVYGIRIIYILLSAFGLIGLFYLSRELFGNRVAALALFLGAIDHHLISYAPEFLEPVYLCLVPWLILSVYRAVYLERANYWIIIGSIGGLGYMCSEIFMLLALPVAIIVIASGKTVTVFKKPQLYIAGFIFFLIILPDLIWNYNHHNINIIRHAGKASPIGLVPRMALLYLGDLLINLKNSSHIVLGLSNTIYSPHVIPCHWASGLLYLFSLGYSLRSFKNRPHALLFAFIFGIGVPVSLLNAKEPWNEIEWGAMTIFPMICLTAWTADQFIVRGPGRVIYFIIFTIITAYTASFLYGPKCGYASPFWEKAFLGDVLYYGWIKKDRQTASTLVEKTIAKYPECAIAHYFQGIFASDPRQKMVSYQKVLVIEPFNPLVYFSIADELIEKNRSLEAFQLLSETISHGNDSFRIRSYLSEAAFNLGNYATAENHLKKALEMKPYAFDLYYRLFHIIARQGRFEESLDILEKFAINTTNPGYVYQMESQYFSRLEDYAKAGMLYQKALEKNPDLPATPSWEIIDLR